MGTDPFFAVKWGQTPFSGPFFAVIGDTPRRREKRKMSGSPHRGEARMKILVALIALTVAFGADAASKPKRTVYLDRPGVLDDIRQNDPKLHERIVQVLRSAQGEPCETLPGILKVQLHVPDVQCRSYQILTSYPPKMHLAFGFGGEVTYVTNVVQRKLGRGQLMPALEQGKAK